MAVKGINFNPPSAHCSYMKSPKSFQKFKLSLSIEDFPQQQCSIFMKEAQTAEKCRTEIFHSPKYSSSCKTKSKNVKNFRRIFPEIPHGE